MTFELVTNASVPSPSAFPAPEDISVRFLFHNGTTSNSSTPVAYPLFGQPALELPWTDFVKGMNAFAVGDQVDWCQACGNSTGVCASVAPQGFPGPGESNDGGRGISKAVAGVIGAMVTLAVILGVEALVFLGAGLRLVRKNRLTSSGSNNGAVTETDKAL